MESILSTLAGNNDDRVVAAEPGSEVGMGMAIADQFAHAEHAYEELMITLARFMGADVDDDTEDIPAAFAAVPRDGAPLEELLASAVSVNRDEVLRVMHLLQFTSQLQNSLRDFGVEPIALMNHDDTVSRMRVQFLDLLLHGEQDDEHDQFDLQREALCAKLREAGLLVEQIGDGATVFRLHLGHVFGSVVIPAERKAVTLAMEFARQVDADELGSFVAFSPYLQPESIERVIPWFNPSYVAGFRHTVTLGQWATIDQDRLFPPQEPISQAPRSWLPSFMQFGREAA